MDPAKVEGMLAEARAGNRTATRRFVKSVTPAMQGRVAKVLLRRGDGRSVRSEVEDIVQDTLIALFSENGKVLRRWDPAKGLSLTNYVALIAERTALSKLRSQRRSPMTEDPTAAEDLPLGTERGPEAAVVSQHTLDHVMRRLREELSERSFRLFEMHWIEERSTAAIQAELEMTRDAVYAGKLRIRKVVTQIELEMREAAQ